MTPSRVTNSRTITFRMTKFLQHLATSQEAVILRWAFRRAQRHASFLFCGSSPKTGTIKEFAENRILAQEGIPTRHSMAIQARMPPRGGGRDEHGRLTLQARITS